MKHSNHWKKNRVQAQPASTVWKIAAAALLLPLLTAQAEIQHEFICVDNQKNQLVYVNQFEPESSWTVSVPKGSRDIDLLADERVLVSHSDGAEIYRLRDGKSAQQFQGFKGVTSASQTPDGSFLIASPSGFSEIDSKGKTLQTIQPDGSIKHLRLARMLKNGNILYCAGFSIFEIDANGSVVWEHTTQGKSYLAIEQNDKNLYSTQGKEVQLLRIDRDGKETVVCGGTDSHPDANLAWLSGYDVLKNGNIVIANWRGHGFTKPSKHLFEFNADNEIVWSWDDPDVKGVTTVQVIR
jgi:hypothetical protein